MTKTKFSEERIIAVPRGRGPRMTIADVGCDHGIGSATLYAWTDNCGGTDLSQVRAKRFSRALARASHRANFACAVICVLLGLPFARFSRLRPLPRRWRRHST